MSDKNYERYLKAGHQKREGNKHIDESIGRAMEHAKNKDFRTAIKSFMDDMGKRAVTQELVTPQVQLKLANKSSDAETLKQAMESLRSQEAIRDYHYVENNIGGTHLKGWHDAKKSAVIALYVQGLASVAQAIAADAQPKHHILRVDNCKTEEEMMTLAVEFAANGIQMSYLESNRKRILAALGVKVKDADYDITKKGHVIAKDGDTISIAEAARRKEQNDITLAGTKRAVEVIKQGKTVIAKAPEKKLTKQQLEVALMMARHEQIEALKAQMAKLKKANEQLDKVGVLTEEEKAEILARNAAKKVTPSDK